MTGEMSWIKPDGEASDGDIYGVHAEVAKALKCELKPFDVYIGPYIAHKAGKIFLGANDDGVGYVCLWPKGVPPAYCSPVVASYGRLQDSHSATLAARAVLKRARQLARSA